MDIGILGFDATAQATLDALRWNRQSLSLRSRNELRVVSVAPPAPLAHGLSLPEGCRLAATLTEVVDDPMIDVVIDVIDDIELAKRVVMKALQRRKHVVTTNGALLAMHGSEIFSHATAHGAIVGFEGSVGGSIPLVKLLREAFAGDRIEALTCVLPECRASAVPPADAASHPAIAGTRASHTLIILAALAFGLPMRQHAIHVSDATVPEACDQDFADDMGYCIRWLASARRHDQACEMRIEPALLPRTHPVARLPAQMSALLLHADMSGTTIHCGTDADSQGRASAVLADLLDIARLLDARPDHHVPPAAFLHEPPTPAPAAADGRQRDGARYLRFNVADDERVVESIGETLARHSIALDTTRQSAAKAGRRDLAVLTRDCSWSHLGRALAQLQPLCHEVVSLPIERLLH